MVSHRRPEDLKEPPLRRCSDPLMDSSDVGGASDVETIGLMADAARLEREAERVEHAARAAKRSLALRAMSRTNSEERERIFRLGVLTPEWILDWAAEEAVLCSRRQRQRWRIFRRD